MVTIYQLQLIFHAFPHLRTLETGLGDEQDDEGKVAPPPSDASFPSLAQLDTIILHNYAKNHTLSTIFALLPSSLRDLTLTGWKVPTINTCTWRLARSCPNLTNLVLLRTNDGNPTGGTDTTHTTATVALIAQLASPAWSSLTSLNIDNGSDAKDWLASVSKTFSSGLSLPNMRRFVLDGAQWVMPHLPRVFPALTELAPFWMNESDFPVLAQYATTLRSFSFPEAAGWVDYRTTDEELNTAFEPCINLTHIRFTNLFYLDTPEGWSTLFSNLSKLTSLAFFQMSNLTLIRNEDAARITQLTFRRSQFKLKDFFISLAAFRSCHVLTFRDLDVFAQSQYEAQEDFNQLYQALETAPSEFLPCIKQFHFEHRVEGEVRHVGIDRTRTVVAPPPSRLVGIELNPGPQMNAQSLFADGLRMIFCYLDNDEFMSAVTRICHSWSAAGRSSASSNRSIGIKLRSADYLTCFHSAVSSFLSRHVTSISISHTATRTTTIESWIRPLYINPGETLNQHVTSTSMGTRPPTFDEWCTIISSMAHFPSLTRIRLEHLPLELDLTPLLDCPHLTDLLLPVYAWHIRKLIPVDPSTTITLDSFPVDSPLTHVIQQMRAISQIPQLITLDINDPGVNFSNANIIDLIVPLLAQHNIVFPQLTRFPMTLSQDFAGTQKWTEELHSIMPQLTQLSADNLMPEAFPIVLQFTRMRQLALGPSFELAEESDLLAPLDQLTSLTFRRWSPNIQQLMDLFTELPLLDSLAFDSIDGPTIEFLRPSYELCTICAHRLRSLRLESTDLNTNQPVKFFESMTNLTSLSLIHAFCHNTQTLDQLITAFSSPEVLPNLKHLELAVKKKNYQTITFVWNEGQRRSKGKNANFRRRRKEEKTTSPSNTSPPAPHLIGIELNPGPTSSSASSNCSITDSSMNAPPASRLVGIELNPGPPQINAQSLFADGLRLIFGYLENAEFFTAVTRICQSWSTTGCSFSSSNHSISIKLRSANYLNRLELASSSLLNRHVISITIAHAVTRKATFDEWSTIISSLPQFPSLNRVRLERLPLKLDLSPLIDCPRLSDLILPAYAQNLRKEVRLDSHLMPILILDSPPNSLLSHFIRQMRTLALMPHLMTLNMDDCGANFVNAHVFDLVVPILAHHQIAFPRLLAFPFTHYIGRKFIGELYSIMPQLTQLTPETFTRDSIPILLKFTHLRHLKLNGGTFSPLLRQEPHVLSPLNQLEHLTFSGWSPKDDSLIEMFSTLPLLASLAFEFSIDFVTPSDSLRTICAQRLHSLRFERTSLPYTHLVTLASYSSLTSLSLIHAFTYHVMTPMTLDRLRDSFSSIDVLPKLKRITLTEYQNFKIQSFVWKEGEKSKGKGKAADNFRRRKEENTSVLPPAPRLVGIELNPGPATQITAQSCFTDGLHLMFSNLATPDLIHAACTCRTWLLAASSMRHIQLRFESTTEEINLLPSVVSAESSSTGPVVKSRFRFLAHVTDFSPWNSLDFHEIFMTQPNLLAVNMPQMQSAVLTIDIDLPEPEPRTRGEPIGIVVPPPVIESILLPSKLHTFEFTTVHLNDKKDHHFNALIRALSSLPSLSTLIFHGSTIEVEEYELENLDYTPLASLSASLTHLTLPLISQHNNNDYKSHVKGTIKAISQLKLLQYLQLSQEDHHMFSIVPQLGLMPHMSRIELSWTTLDSKFLPALHSVMPNLTAMDRLPSNHVVVEIDGLHVFEKLQEWTFYSKPSVGGQKQLLGGSSSAAASAADIKPTDDAIFDHLLQCRSLTHLRFAGDWYPRDALEWTRITSGLSHLTHLSFEGFITSRALTTIDAASAARIRCLTLTATSVDFRLLAPFLRCQRLRILVTELKSHTWREIYNLFSHNSHGEDTAFLPALTFLHLADTDFDVLFEYDSERYTNRVEFPGCTNEQRQLHR